ncbi:MAG: RNA-binding protein [Candidatus Methanomethylicia archaeon]|nr:RNA-binding protein [Candidatus Methanomethylicia archaeon]MCX8169269.1 RNA-binding protein [Candidatus Methanomethylicia archaeon]MDW7988949.1 putative RNA uridine N3 methyltransferase [Nitrososphaerota archaeon]
MFNPQKREKLLSIALPASLTADYNLRDKTIKVGIIARIAAIYRVDEIFIYIDKYGVEDEGELLNMLLKYCETPQYLRKYVYKLSAFLRFAGLLPPLKIPSHVVTDDITRVKNGEFREGVVVKSNKKGSWIDIGFKKPYFISQRIRKGERVTVRVYRENDEELKLHIVSKDEVNLYWGYKVHYEYDNIVDLVRKSNADLVIATSRYGHMIYNVIDELNEAIDRSNKILVLFGSPHEGLFEICKRFNVELSKFAHFIVNTIPFQGCETVRTEEALASTLSILNILPHIQTRKK